MTASCTSAEREFLDAALTTETGKEVAERIRKARTAVMEERITCDLRDGLEHAIVDLHRANERYMAAWKKVSQLTSTSYAEDIDEAIRARLRDAGRIT